MRSSLLSLLSGWLWIDAICVDQENVNERNQQIGLMADIYTRAVKVVVWLGPSHHDSDLAIGFARSCGSKEHTLSSQLPLDGKTAVAFRALCYRPYWTRLWVYQELMLARQAELWCGAQMIGWETFMSSISRVVNLDRD